MIAVAVAHSYRMAGCLQQVYQVRQVVHPSLDQVDRRSKAGHLPEALASLAKVVLRLCEDTAARLTADKVGERDHHNGRHLLVR